jgi:hypothetical protein
MAVRTFPSKVGVRVTVPGAAADLVHPELDSFATPVVCVVVDDEDGAVLVVGAAEDGGGVELAPPQAAPTTATARATTADIPTRLDPPRST